MPTRICRHIRPSGRRCQTRAMRGNPLCYYHLKLTEKHNGDVPAFLHTLETMPSQHRDPEYFKKNRFDAQYYGLRPAGPDDIDLPPLEDADSIQIALSTVLNALAQRRIETKRASVLLFGLQVARVNLNTLRREQPQLDPASEPVLETVLNEHGELIAPDDDPTHELASPPKHFALSVASGTVGHMESVESVLGPIDEPGLEAISAANPSIMQEEV
jgi:hypothetical protein